MTDKIYFRYPSSVTLGRGIWIFMFFSLIVITLLSIGQRVIPDFRIFSETPCDSSRVSCAFFSFLMLLSIILLFLIINTRPALAVDGRGVTIYFFLKTTFLSWDQLQGIRFRKRGVLQYWIIYSDRLPFFCKVYGLMFLRSQSGFLISKTIDNANDLVMRLQINMKARRA